MTLRVEGGDDTCKHATWTTADACKQLIYGQCTVREGGKGEKDSVDRLNDKMSELLKNE